VEFEPLGNLCRCHPVFTGILDTERALEKFAIFNLQFFRIRKNKRTLWDVYGHSAVPVFLTTELKMLNIPILVNITHYCFTPFYFKIGFFPGNSTHGVLYARIPRNKLVGHLFVEARVKGVINLVSGSWVTFNADFLHKSVSFKNI